MLRGVVILSTSEADAAQAVLAQYSQKSDLLIQKLSAAPASPYLELSEDEAERILDVLPAPSEHQSEVSLMLRKKIATFLLELRTK